MRSKTLEQNQRRFLFGIILNTLFALFEMYYGFVANSVALIADAVHNLSDVIGLSISWFSYYLAQRQVSHKFTYGFKNATIFAAFLNCLILIIVIVNLLWESVSRLMSPEGVLPLLVIGVASIGVIVNTSCALLFYAGNKRDLNIRSAFLNMSLDALVSIAVVIGGIFIYWKGWYSIDAILGIIIGIFIMYSFWHLFKESLHLILQAVPSNIDLQAVIRDIKSFPGITGYHDLHIWAMSTTETALSVHIETTERDFNPALTTKLAALFRDKYDIMHATIQLEVAGGAKSCILRC